MNTPITKRVPNVVSGKFACGRVITSSTLPFVINKHSSVCSVCKEVEKSVGKGNAMFLGLVSSIPKLDERTANRKINKKLKEMQSAWRWS